MRLTVKQYAKILDESLVKASSESEYKDIIKQFVALVSKDNKVSKMNDILSHFNKLHNKRHDSIDVLITSADKEPIKFPTHIAGKKVSITKKEDPKILGGQIIKIGDYIIDNSIRSKVNTLR